MRITMSFRKTDFEAQEEDPGKMVSSCNDDIMGSFKGFHSELLRHCGHPGPIEELEDEANMQVWTLKFRLLVLCSCECVFIN